MLTDACYALTGGELLVRVSGYAPTREVSGIKVDLNGAEIKGLNVSVIATDYFTSDLSVRTGGAFQIEMPLPVPASTNALRVESLKVSLQNRLGSSGERSARACN